MITVHEAEDLAAQALCSIGVPSVQARTTAQLLVTADVWGIGSHGLLRLPHYLQRLVAGGQSATACLEVVRDTGPVVAYDGHDGLGHWQLWQAATVAADRAAGYGIAAASVGRSSHCGALGLYVAPAVRKGLLALVLSTGPAVMAPPGAASPQLSTSPLAAGVPDDHGGWAIIDLATSAVARGRIAAAARRGETLPTGWAVDANGQPTQDPAAALAGMLTPMGGTKGFALAYLVEALTGAAVGPALATQAADMLNPAHNDRPQRLGHLVITLDPATVDVDGHGPARQSLLGHNVTAAGGRIPGASRALPGDTPPDAVIDIAADLVEEIRSWSHNSQHRRQDR